MSQLPDPISDVLEDTAGEARIQRIWRGVEQGKQPRRRAPSARTTTWVAGGVIAAAAAILFMLWPTEAPPGPLTLEGGASVPRRVEDRVTLSDASVVRVSEGAVILQRNDATHADWLLESGRARFDVTPHGPRTWTIEIGLATVEVVGTAFVVERGDGWSRVEVERGRVIVRGERVPDRSIALGAGDAIRVEADRGGEPASEAPPTPTTDEVSPTPADPAVEAAPESSPEPPVDDSPAHPGDTGPDAAALLRMADAARSAGRLEEAAGYLRRAALRRRDPSSGVAAFTLGRLELDALHRPVRAAEAFGWALERPLTPRLREDALARRSEALRAAGQGAAADRAARAYLRAHPAGRYAAELREALEGP